MPFEVKFKRHTEANGFASRWTIITCLASRDVPGARCLDLHRQSMHRAIIYSFKGSVCKFEIRRILKFLQTHRTESDPEPPELLLQLFPNNRKKLEKGLHWLTVKALEQAARGEP